MAYVAPIFPDCRNIREMQLCKQMEQSCCMSEKSWETRGTQLKGIGHCPLKPEPIRQKWMLGNRVCPQPSRRWEDEPSPGASTEQQRMGVKTRLEAGLQPPSKTVGDRQKERTGSPVPSREYGTHVRLMEATKLSQCHQDPISWCKVGIQDLWQLLLQGGKS